MKKNTHPLLAFLAATVLLCGALFTVGCNTLQKAQDEYPIAYDLLKGGAEIYLTNYLATTDDPFVADNRTALLGATRAVFAEQEDPRNVGVALSQKIEGLYPDDPATRDAILRNLAVVLRSEPDPDTPASGPNAEAQRAYNADLAEALAPAAPSSAQVSEFDYSLGGWVTSYPFSQEYWQSLHDYYNPPTQSEIEQARKLKALAAATGEDGSVDHATYRRLSQ